MSRHETIKAYSAWASVCLFWGTTYLAIRIGVDTLPPALFAGLRFLFAGVIFVLILKVRGYALPKRSELLDIAIVGIALLVIANGSVVWAEQWVPSSLAALIVATLPFWMVGIESAIRGGDKLTVKKVVGILVGFSGLVLLLLPELQNSLDSNYLAGVLALFLAAASWAGGSIYSKRRKLNTAPLMAAAVQTLVAGIILVIIGAGFGEFSRLTFEWQGWAALGYLLVFGSIIGYGSYIYALAKLPAAFVSTYAYINPIIAVVLGWWILDERLDWLTGLATVVILLGVIVVKSDHVKKRPAVEPSNGRSELHEEKEAVI